jgi:hypothetical protein
MSVRVDESQSIERPDVTFQPHAKPSPIQLAPEFSKWTSQKQPHITIVSSFLIG